jgi:hypothetical protein
MTDFAAFAREIARRREQAGVVDLPRNEGTRRTASKQALLRSIEQTGTKW